MERSALGVDGKLEGKALEPHRLERSSQGIPLNDIRGNSQFIFEGRFRSCFGFGFHHTGKADGWRLTSFRSLNILIDDMDNDVDEA